MPALGVVAVLAALVVLTRFDSGPPPTSREPSPPAMADVATAFPTHAPEPSSFIRVPAVEPTPGVDPSASEYRDGIPTNLDGERVLRIPEALSTTPGTTILVGGWHKAKPCRDRRARSCPVQTLADTDLEVVGDLSTAWVVLDRPRGIGVGARVLRATVEPDPSCSITRQGECQPRLRVLRVLWLNEWQRKSALQ
ncbi:MAG TPA: hypothetical protein VMZ33_06285 [Candidatus Limnocylindrales bacterium]|nr:hypothetical protein [Candidatus Limnocylindrales bacterium]